jgi:DNA-binding response OmpR family regulator
VRDSITARILVLVIGSGTSVGDGVAAFEAGADDYVMRPFRTCELLLRVRALLRRMRVKARSARETIVADVWPEDAPSQRVVDTTMKRLRKKLPAVGRRIRTIRGVGYELTLDDADP